MKTRYLIIPAFLALLTGFAGAQTASTFSPTIKFKALVQPRFESSLSDSVDIFNKYSANPLMDNFRLRRLEFRADITFTPNLTGTIRFQFPDLKTSTPGKAIELAYANYRVKDCFQIRAGQFKDPFELDEQTSHEDLRMIDRGPTSKMFTDNYLASYQPGIMIFGNLLENTTPFNYYVALVNGSDRSVPYDNNSQKNYIGRIEYTPIKGFRIGINDQLIGLSSDTTGNAFGVDLSIQRNITQKTLMILEGEYIKGTNVLAWKSDTSSTKEVSNFDMGGYFGQLLFKINIQKKWCKTFEIGGKFENTDPRMYIDNNEYMTVTGDVGFDFLPDNDARLQLNIIHTNWQTPIGGTIDAANQFVAQFQIKI